MENLLLFFSKFHNHYSIQCSPFCRTAQSAGAIEYTDYFSADG